MKGFTYIRTTGCTPRKSQHSYAKTISSLIKTEATIDRYTAQSGFCEVR